MARTGFSTANYLTWPISGVGSTDRVFVVGWIDGANTGDTLFFGVGDKDTADDQHRLAATSLAVYASTYDGASSNSTANNSMSSGGRHHLALMASNSFRQAAVDGVKDTTNSETRAVANIDIIRVGTSPDSTPFGSFSGKMSGMAAWKVSSSEFFLTDEELAALASGVHPMYIRPSKLLWMPDPSMTVDLITGNTVTVTGTVSAAESTLITSAWPIYVNAVPAVGGDVTATPNAGSLTLTGASPSVALLLNTSPAAASLALTGEQPSVGTLVDVALNADSLSITGAQPGVARLLNFSLTADSLTVAGEQPTVTVEEPGIVAADPNPGSLSITGATAGVALILDRSLAAASLALTGEQPGVVVESAVNVDLNAGSLALTGASPTVALRINVSPVAATLSITGSEIGVDAPGQAQPAGQTPAGSSRGRRQRGYPRKVMIDGVVYTVRSPEELKRLLAQRQEQLEAELEALQASEAPAAEMRSIKRQITVIRRKVNTAEVEARAALQRILDDDEEVIEIWAALH